MSREIDAMVAEKVHVKLEVQNPRPLCGFDPGTAPMAWTTSASARVLATCAACLTEVLRPDCSICDGKGTFEGTGCCDEHGPEEYPCSHCDGEYFIDERERLPALSPAAKPQEQK